VLTIARGTKSPFTDEIIQAAEKNQQLPTVPARAYLLPELTKDMSALSFLELNEFRGPILSQLGLDLLNASDYDSKSHLWKRSCNRLYAKALNSSKGLWPPPPQPPADLRDYYTMGDRVPILSFYIYDQMQQYNGGRGYVWDAQMVDRLAAQPNCDCGQYVKSVCDATIRKYEHFISGKTGVVVGSETPWAEAALIKHNASQVSTIEYMPIETNHPKLKTYHPAKVF